MKTKTSMKSTERVSVVKVSADGHVFRNGEAMVNKAIAEGLKKGEYQQILYKGEYVNAYLSGSEYDGSKTYYVL